MMFLKVASSGYSVGFIYRKCLKYVLSSGANELAVQKAKAEITRLIKEELIRLVSEISRIQRESALIYVS